MYWQGVLEGGLLNGHVEELNWKTYLRSKVRVVDNERELYLVFTLSHLNEAIWVLAFGYVLIQLRFLPKHFSGRIQNFGSVAWPEFANWCCGGYKINEYCLWLYGVNCDKLYVTEHRWINQKYIKYIENDPTPWNKVLFSTSNLSPIYLFTVYYSDDERNIFVPNVDTVTQRFNEILAWHQRPTD